MMAAQVYANAMAGNRNEAQKKLTKLIEASEKESVEPYFMAWAFAGLEKKERAMDFLQKAFESRSCFMRLIIKVDPWLDTLRSDRKFVELLKKMGLEMEG